MEALQIIKDAQPSRTSEKRRLVFGKTLYDFLTMNIIESLKSRQRHFYLSYVVTATSIHFCTQKQRARILKLLHTKITCTVGYSLVKK